MWWVHSDKLDYSFLATLFNIQIKGLADRFVTEIKENVNPGTQKGEFSKIPVENRQNIQSQIVVCYSR